MHIQSQSRNQALHRAAAIPAAALAACLFTATAMAQSPQAEAPTVPILKGGYVLTATENCLPDSAGLRNETASLTFDPKSGTAKIKGYVMSGDPLSLNPAKGSASYSNSTQTLTLGSQTYQAVYGHREKGIATYVSFMAVEPDGCGYQGWLSRQ
ncbi:MAG TPA: hypothetical protein VHW69_00340 [Rhizomicrobium sp.]|jgi:hypothetical protein|nr:hypothetical protein [Rhizomicrobium sp.]